MKKNAKDQKMKVIKSNKNNKGEYKKNFPSSCCLKEN